VRKLLICALALGGFAASAQAADLDLGSMKDPLPDTLTYKGVTVYGAIDVGYAYQTHGVPLSGALGTGLEYNMIGSSNMKNKPVSSLSNSGLTQSFVGVKAEEALGMGWTAIAKVETGFQPLSGELADGCASLQRQNGLTAIQTTAAKGDSSRCGQTFNGPVYVGVSNAAYGTLTVGRQNTLELDLIAAYDPMALSYAFSLIGYSGGAGAGIGDTEAGRWDNSLKYVYQYGPVHAAFMYADGSSDNSIQNSAIASGAGATWRGLSVDVLYTKENGAVSGSSMSAAQCAAVGLTVPACQGTKILATTISDNAAWTVGAKYTFDMGGYGFKDGGYKDEVSSAKFTVFGGYQHVDMTNPTDPVFRGTTIGGYVMSGTDSIAGVGPNNHAFFTTKTIQTGWAGAKYETGPWAFTGAYYHFDQNSWRTGAAGTACTKGAAFNSASSNCAGNFDMGSFLVDYTFNKHFDIYAGVNYSKVDGGLASGFLVDDSFLFMTGMRLRF
jgi:predicted porin